MKFPLIQSSLITIGTYLNPQYLSCTLVVVTIPFATKKNNPKNNILIRLIC